ncbi:hypothetical protein TPA0906_66170 [Streptomyces olivaceus]|uniref:hypothetical protein n=1 Tax=Streptomyces olivaceus TaxID=47716 RepID=UPI0022EE590B|nr:hypothetical protein [Streptomyces olivaceus]GHJ04752.1 hypothetical protein TPA0906_66170 [Streptomyces olivaceus]
MNIEAILIGLLSVAHTPEQAEHAARTVLRDHAHQLAETIRTTELPEIQVDMFDNGTQWAADLIDPDKP